MSPYKEDQARLHTGHGAQSMGLVRRLVFNLVRIGRGKKLIKTARKVAGWDAAFLERIINTPTVTVR